MLSYQRGEEVSASAPALKREQDSRAAAVAHLVFANAATLGTDGGPSLWTPVRASCFSAEGGADACSILANTDRPVRSNRAGGATSAFLESDRRDFPAADERNGERLSQ
jgi:hypothetical protein